MINNYFKLLSVLKENQVDFVIIGGVAAIMHGSVRFTFDLDVVYSRNTANLERIIRSLTPYHPYLRGAPKDLPFKWDVLTLKNGLNFTFTTDLGDIDFLGEVSGCGKYEDIIKDAKEIIVKEDNYNCISLDMLILAKRAAGRAKDLEALAELEILQRKKNL